DHRLAGDFTGDDGDARGNHGFAGHAAVWVLGEQRVEDAIGDLVGQLVGVAHADRLAGKQEFALCHGNLSYIANDSTKCVATATKKMHYRRFPLSLATGEPIASNWALAVGSGGGLSSGTTRSSCRA